METKFNSRICTTRELSERLLSLGLKEETADMKYPCTREYYGGVLTEGISSLPLIIDTEDDEVTEYDLPAWSLHRLLCMLPKEFEANATPIFGRNHTTAVELKITCELDLVYNELNNDEFKGFYGADIYDSAIKCIEWLIKEGYFNKEYLV